MIPRALTRGIERILQKENPGSDHVYGADDDGREGRIFEPLFVRADVREDHSREHSGRGTKESYNGDGSP